MSPDAARDLKAFLRSIDTCADGDLIAVPEFNADGALYALRTQLAGTRRDHMADDDRRQDVAGASDAEATPARHKPSADDRSGALEALMLLSGTAARVKRDGTYGQAVLNYQDTLPEDLRPLLVMDASGRVRETYAQMQAHRGDLVPLKAAVKDYSPLRIGVWRKAGSKTGFINDGKTLVTGVVETVLTRPDDPWLIVTHKRAGKMNIEADIRRALRGRLDPAKLGFLHWGAHMASNDYAEVPNLILAGTQFMPDSYYLGLTHLAQDLAMSQGLATAADVATIRRGEHRHLVLQALCRGRVRLCDGARCQPMRAYVIASPASGIEADLPAVFPGCVVETWQPVRPVLKGALRRAVNHVAKAASRGETMITLNDVAAAIKLQPSNFHRSVGSKPAWVDETRRLGFETIRIAHGAKALRRVTAGATPPPAAAREAA